METPLSRLADYMQADNRNIFEVIFKLIIVIAMYAIIIGAIIFITNAIDALGGTIVGKILIIIGGIFGVIVLIISSIVVIGEIIKWIEQL